MPHSGQRLPLAVYSSAQVREFDRRAIGQGYCSGFELMQRAAQASFGLLRDRWPDRRIIQVFCGAGNNAGDGYLLAALAHQAGLDVTVVALVEPDCLAGDAALAVARAREAGVRIGGPADEIRPDATVVDALLGTGIDRDLGGDIARAVERINAAGGAVLSLDIPTGIDADTGAVRGTAVRAEATITFVGLKVGLYLGSGPDYCGQLSCCDLQIPAEVFAGTVPVMSRIDPELPGRILRPRLRSSHKGLNGKVLVVGGGGAMGGAVRLAAEAALRCGAGLAYAAVAPESVPAVTAGRPEIICRGVVSPEEIRAWADAADVIVIGPGLGRSDWAAALMASMLATDKPLVVDADALNHLAAHRRSRRNWVLTPHPGEAGRLLDLPAADVQQQRQQSALQLAEEYGALAVLKGACSLVAGPGDGDARLAVCDHGNPGMATAGMGDVLAGVLGGLIAQFGLSRKIIELGVLIHAQAGDRAALDGERGLLASDLFRHLRNLVNPA